jgi:hypothetical protein
VTFSARGSRDADGRVVRYLWDLDGDGRFELDSTNATVKHRYPRARTVIAKVRIVDDLGATAVASRRVTVGGSRALRLAAPGGQGKQVVRRRAVVVSATCSGRCRIVARGTVTIPGTPRPAPLTAATRRLAGGRRGTLRLALPGRTRSALARALAEGKRAAATVTVTGIGVGGRRHVATVRIALRP